MGIIIDIFLIAITILASFVGYKKGLIRLGTGLFAGIISIVIILIIYKPVSTMIINNTAIDEKIENIIVEKTMNVISEKTQVTGVISNNIENDIVTKQAREISKKIVYYLIAVILFIFIKIALSIVITLLDVVAKFPVLKQFNEIGGIIYGILQGILISCIIVLMIGIYAKMNPASNINNKIEESYITKLIYERIIRF